MLAAVRMRQRLIDRIEYRSWGYSNGLLNHQHLLHLLTVSHSTTSVHFDSQATSEAKTSLVAVRCHSLVLAWIPNRRPNLVT